MEENKNQHRHICRAMITASAEGADYDFEAVAVPASNQQLKYNYENGEYFYQVLRTGKDNVKSERLESGLNLFDNHDWDKSAMRTLGITTAYEFTEQGIVIRAKFGARADKALKSDVKNGIIKSVSIEGDVIDYVIERKQGEIPVYYAELWEPTSLSFAPVPNDPNAQISVKRALEVMNDNNENTDKSVINSLKSKF